MYFVLNISPTQNKFLMAVILNRENAEIWYQSEHEVRIHKSCNINPNPLLSVHLLPFSFRLGWTFSFMTWLHACILIQGIALSPSATNNLLYPFLLSVKGRTFARTTPTKQPLLFKSQHKMYRINARFEESRLAHIFCSVFMNIAKSQCFEFWKT